MRRLSLHVIPVSDHGIADDEEEDSTPPTSPPQVAVRRSKFDDEEDNDDVADNWEEEDDSEAEAEKAKQAAEAKAKADAAAAAAKKSKAQRIEEHRNERLRQRLEEDEDETSDEDEAEKRRIAKEQEKAGDLKHAEDLFGDLTGPAKKTARPVVAVDADDPTSSVDLSSLKVFNPVTKDQFTKLREALVPLINAQSKKGPYVLFLQDLCRGLCAELPSNEVKKISTVLTTLSNEKMREEKQAEKGGKKTKAQQTKAKLSAGRDISFKADTTAYDDDGMDE